MTRDYIAAQSAAAKGQHPAAVILSCIDSRAPAEVIMDLGIGDVFNSRVAGNISNDDILGSMEFACKVAGAKVALVMGHTSCGAIKGAIDGVKLGNLTGLLAKIHPAVAGDYLSGRSLVEEPRIRRCCGKKERGVDDDFDSDEQRGTSRSGVRESSKDCRSNLRSEYGKGGLPRLNSTGGALQPPPFALAARNLLHPRSRNGHPDPASPIRPLVENRRALGEDVYPGPKVAFIYDYTARRSRAGAAGRSAGIKSQASAA